MLAHALDSLHRREGGRILATLIRQFGFDVAEEALQDAYAKALAAWPGSGMPDNPAAWLTTVARHRALDRVRRDRRIVDDGERVLEAIEAPAADDAVTADGSSVDDDLLRLIFTCCHPALPARSQAALALRTLCGLSTREIARAFVEPEATTAQRIVRARQKIAIARIPYEIPRASELPARIATVLEVIYLMFNEGYTTTERERLIGGTLCNEAIRLATLASSLMVAAPSLSGAAAEAEGLLALMLFHDARREARTDGDGALVPLDEQDRALWDRAAIDQATRLLDQAIVRRAAGPYQIQAAIAALHAQAPTAAATDWAQISALYGALLRHLPTPVVELNAAVATAMATTPSQGLDRIDRIVASGALAGYPLLHAARADLLRRDGRTAEAAVAYRAAIAITRNPVELRYLQRRLATLA